MSTARHTALAALVAASLASACDSSDTASRPAAPVAVDAPPTAAERVPSTPVTSIPGHETLAQDNTPKEGPRLMPAETYIRSYLALFGDLAPRDVEQRARAMDGSALFDTWNDYLAALGLPDYRVDGPRGTQTNALMMATFERLGVALCDRAAERDLRASLPVAQRAVYAFDGAPTGVDLAGFTSRFDVLHRTFLGYPAALAPSARTGRFYQLYRDTVARHQAPGAPASRLTPEQAGWATVCYGLVRHPEFHAY